MLCGGCTPRRAGSGPDVVDWPRVDTVLSGCGTRAGPDQPVANLRRRSCTDVATLVQHRSTAAAQSSAHGALQESCRPAMTLPPIGPVCRQRRGRAADRIHCATRPLVPWPSSRSMISSVRPVFESVLRLPT